MCGYLNALTLSIIRGFLLFLGTYIMYLVRKSYDNDIPLNLVLKLNLVFTIILTSLFVLATYIFQSTWNISFKDIISFIIGSHILAYLTFFWSDYENDLLEPFNNKLILSLLFPIFGFMSILFMFIAVDISIVLIIVSILFIYTYNFVRIDKLQNKIFKIVLNNGVFVERNGLNKAYIYKKIKVHVQEGIFDNNLEYKAIEDIVNNKILEKGGLFDNFYFKDTGRGPTFSYINNLVSQIIK